MIADIVCLGCGTIMTRDERIPVFNGINDFDFGCCECLSTELDELPKKLQRQVTPLTACLEDIGRTLGNLYE